ncbi:hypothetical protein KCU73_g7341, partial [Aureobasidium melanogenum]
MAELTGSIVLRQPSDVFPPPLPHEYNFLRCGPLPDYKLHVRHPRTHEVLISLSAWDHRDGAVHFGLVHNACAVIAGNRHDGYLSRFTDASAQRLTMKHDDLLPARPEAYFYHVPGEDGYPIVPTFDLWHDPLSLPSAWTWLEQDDESDAASCAGQVGYAPSVPSRGKTCRLSNHSTAVMPCPLLSAKSNLCCFGNDTHVSDQSLIPTVRSSSPNAVECVYLDANLRHTFSNGSWIFFPKCPGTFVAHFLKPVADQVALYHNVTTRPLECELRALYQSFARTVFALRHGHQYRSALKDGNTDETTWAGRDELGHRDDSTISPKEGCDFTYQDAVTKRQRTLSFASDSSLESTVPSVSLTNSDEFDDELIHHSASIGPSSQNGEYVVELQREWLATNCTRNTTRL